MSNTPEASKELYCPYRVDGSGRCLSDTCMMWRWSRAKETKAYLDEVQRFMAETGENFNAATNKIYAKLGSTFERTEGYCGLAGRPE